MLHHLFPRATGISLLLVALLLAPTPLLAYTSGDNRDDSEIYVGINPAGYPYFNGLLPETYQVAVYPDRRWMIGVEYGYGIRKADLALVDSTSYPYAVFPFFSPFGYGPELITLGTSTPSGHVNYFIRDMEVSDSGMYFRYFPYSDSLKWLNGLYATFALNYRAWNGTAVAVAGDGTDDIFTKERLKLSGKAAFAHISAEATVASLGIGHFVQFDYGLTVGGTWLLASTDVGSSYQYKIRSAQGLSPEETRQARKNFNRLGQRLNQISSESSAARLMLGWSF